MLCPRGVCLGLITAGWWYAGLHKVSAAASSDDFPHYQADILQGKLPALPLYMKVYGSIFQTAYYFIDIFLGAPKPKPYSMIIDTGSSTQGLPCSNCRMCGTDHWEKPYAIEDSKFNQKVPCGNCTTCRLNTDHDTLKQVVEPFISDNSSPILTSENITNLLLDNSDAMQCLYNVHYAEGSRLQGLFYMDVLWLNMIADRSKSGQILPPDFSTHDKCPRFPLQPGPSVPVTVPVGCHVEETHLFHDQKASGILGLEFWGSRGITTFPTSILNDMQQLYAADSLEAADCGDKVAEASEQSRFEYCFSICLSSKGGSLSFGGAHNRLRPHGHSVKEIPLLAHAWRSQSYTIGMTKLAILHNETLSPPLHSQSYFATLRNASAFIDIPLRHPSTVRHEDKYEKVMPTLVDSGTTLTYLPPRLFGEVLFNIENRVAINTSIRDRLKLLHSTHRKLERVNPATLFSSDGTDLVIRDRFMLQADRSRRRDLEFMPIATALVSTGPKRLVRVNSGMREPGGRTLYSILESRLPEFERSEVRRRMLSDNNSPGWYAVLEPSADPAAEPLDSLVGFLDIPPEMEAAAPRALISKLDGYNNGECWWLQDPRKDLPMFPIIKYTFYPEQEIFWHPTTYMYSGSNQHFWCLATMTDTSRDGSTDDSIDSEAIFGSNSFMHQDITFRHDGEPYSIEPEQMLPQFGLNGSEYHLHPFGSIEFAEADCPEVMIEK